MKKTLITLLLTLVAWHAFAQNDDILTRIQAKGKSTSSITARLERNIVKSNSTKYQPGKLYYSAPDKLAAIFNDGDYMIINGNKMSIDIGMFHGTFTVSRNKMMRTMSHIFLYGMQGNARQLASANEYELSFKEEGTCHEVIFVNHDEPFINIGVNYNKVILKYGKRDLLIKEIILYDSKGNVDTYTISEVKHNVAVDEKNFEF